MIKVCQENKKNVVVGDWNLLLVYLLKMVYCYISLFQGVSPPLTSGKSPKKADLLAAVRILHQTNEM